MPSIFKDEIEFFTILSKLILKRIRKYSVEFTEQNGLEKSLRECSQKSIQELRESGLLEVDIRLTSISLAKLVEIDTEGFEPKINLWPLVMVIFPLAKLRDVTTLKVTLVDSDGGSLNESTNGRFIDLS